MYDISPEELKDYKAYTIVDIRDSMSYAYGHLPDAISVPQAELSTHPLGFLPRGSLFPYPHPYPAKGVLAIRHTNDCVSNPVISGTLRSVRPGGLYRYLRIVRFLEVSVIMQLHRYTHEIINIA